jgi:hypothetical protein
MRLKLNRWLSLGLLILFIIALYAFNDTAVVPFVLDVANSTLYLKETEDDDPLGEVRNARTDVALLHCENEVREGRGGAAVPSASEREYKAWSLGDLTYIIKASVDLPGENGALARYRYACKIHWNGKEMNDAGNWSVYGADVNEG